MDLMIEEFRQKLIDLTNETELPIEVKRMVFCELTSQIATASQNAILLQRKELKNEQSIHKD